MLEKILLADSGTGHSEEMLKALMDLPSIQKASVTVLHVVSPQVSAETMTSKWEEGGKVLATAIQSLHLDPTKVSAILRQGDPKDVVCQVAEEIDADLIIMGSRGLKRLQSILSNSVSQYVFQLSSRPMLLVKDDIYVKKINRIMVAVDGSEAAKQCLQLALFLLRDIKGGQLILAHVDKGAATPGEKDPILAEAIAEAKKQGIQPRAISTTGKPGEEICRIAAENNVDLLMLGSPDRRPSIAKSFVDLDRLLGSSLSDYVRVNANCPVLLARTVG
ncbi:universal stress protein [Chroogloeocystis siderophila]|jgi:nucleotide-binding universal stress UspA family protein|uniref:Universal stress protein UspA n=1 Tax=Chroogloeocystis siderophila 5.2 s.c.1 TaxID=247279 RepID=A0A1U7HM16_9CHRO|nr:universal stress protein [Chroogloeocystis siderophila]OKH24617.1 universal stress protein UspA [Chroogloeocystis siderophila 5.2 s.c.1]